MRVFPTHRTIQSGDEKAWGENVLSGINVPTRQLPCSRFYNSYEVTNKSLNVQKSNIRRDRKVMAKNIAEENIAIIHSPGLFNFLKMQKLNLLELSMKMGF
jgi:hypothetical protein